MAVPLAKQRRKNTATHLSDAELARLKALAQSEERTVSAYIRLLVVADIRRHENVERTHARAATRQGKDIRAPGL